MHAPFNINVSLLLTLIFACDVGLFDDKIKRAPVSTRGEPWPEPQHIAGRTYSNLIYNVNPSTLTFDLSNDDKCDVIKHALKRYRNEIRTFANYAKVRASVFCRLAFVMVSKTNKKVRYILTLSDYVVCLPMTFRL